MKIHEVANHGGIEVVRQELSKRVFVDTRDELGLSISGEPVS